MLLAYFFHLSRQKQIDQWLLTRPSWCHSSQFRFHKQKKMALLFFLLKHFSIQNISCQSPFNCWPILHTITDKKISIGSMNNKRQYPWSILVMIKSIILRLTRLWARKKECVWPGQWYFNLVKIPSWFVTQNCGLKLAKSWSKNSDNNGCKDSFP